MLCYLVGLHFQTDYDCGYFNGQGEIVPMKRCVVEKCCCTKPCRPCPKPYCPPPRVICYSCPSCPEYAAYWANQDAAMANDVNNVRGAPAPSQVDKWESTGFNDNGNRTGSNAMMKDSGTMMKDSGTMMNK